MITPEQQTFIIMAVRAAKSAGHIFPAMATCEAALESAWGASQLAREGNNLFGSKQQRHPVYDTLHIPTREFIHHTWITVEAAWVHYPDVPTCFRERMNTLERLKGEYPHYAAALAAKTPEEYVNEVSRSWSTDPERAAKVLSIYREHGASLLAALR